MLWLLIHTLADVPKRLPPPRERGENLYKDLCWQCHGQTGKGDGPLVQSLFMTLSDISGTSTDSQKERINIIQRGKGKMPAYEQVIDRHDSRRILLWLENPVPQKKKEEDSTKSSEEKK
jgi:mono/diheme cytochrome c family protein